MDKRKIAAAVFGTALMLASGSGYAFNARGAGSVYDYGDRAPQHRKEQDRALRQAIKEERAEYKMLRKAGDPRAAIAAEQLDYLNAQWHALHGNGNERGNGRWKSGESDRRQNPYGTLNRQRGADDDEGDDRGTKGQYERGRGHGHGQQDEHDD